MGRKPYTKEVTLLRDGKKIRKKVQFFGWELTDSVGKIKDYFGLK
jgi:hypothetical protein